MSQPEPPVDREQSPLRRLLSRVDRWASRPLTALIVIAADLAWVLLSVAMGFPGLEERIFQTLVAALTLAIVFVIQHTQAREQAATQRKLDEILQALPGADNSLLMLEHASHDELRATGDAHREIQQAALDKQSSASTPAGLPASESRARRGGRYPERGSWPRSSCPSALQSARHFGLSIIRRERVCRAHGENAVSVSAVSGELHFGEACRQNGRLNT